MLHSVIAIYVQHEPIWCTTAYNVKGWS